MTSMTSRFAPQQAHVVRANTHLRSRPAGLFAYLPAAQWLRAAHAAAQLMPLLLAKLVVALRQRRVTGKVVLTAG
jgi:hypothetical protein